MELTDEGTLPQNTLAHTTSVAFPSITPAVTVSDVDVSQPSTSWFGSLSRSAAAKLVATSSKTEGGNAPIMAQLSSREDAGREVMNTTVHGEEMIGEDGDNGAALAAEENTPRLRVTSSPAAVSPDILERKIQDTERRSSFSSPNPSTSRFSLRIPLLGTFGVLPSQIDTEPAQAPGVEHVPRSPLEGNESIHTHIVHRY